MANGMPPGNESPNAYPAPVVQSTAVAAPGEFAPSRVGTEAAGGGDWRRYVSALQRHKWLVAGFTAVGLVAGIVATRFLRPTYVAQATVWVEQQTRESRSEGPIRSSQLLEDQGWVDLMKSGQVLDSAVARLRLYIHPVTPLETDVFAGFALRERFRPGTYRVARGGAGESFTLASADGAVLDRAAVGDSLGRSLGFNWVPPADALPPGRSVEFDVTTPRDAATALGSRLRIVSDRQAQFIRVELKGPSPVRVAATVNAVVERYVDLAAELKRERLSELRAILDDQLARASDNLRRAELSLQNYRIQTITLPSDPIPVAPGLEETRDPVFTNFFDMKIEAEQLRRDRMSVERALAGADSAGVHVDALEVIGAVQNSSPLSGALTELTERQAQLRALRTKYTDDYAPVRRLRQEIETMERRTIPALARGLVSELQAREAELSDRIDDASRELRRIPARSIEEARLRREVQVAEQTYTDVQARHEDARLAEASTLPDVRILDRAVVPERPTQNRAPALVFLGLLGGLGMGVLAALLLDRVDRRVRYPEQVTMEMGLPILGVVPYLKGSRNGLKAQDAAPVIEALRGIRLNLVHAYGTVGPLLVTVTSPGTGDGKSFVASNLALAFADAGHRTLLIDGDVRRGALHRVVNAQRKPGLTDILAGKTPREECIQTTEYKALEFIGCGTRLSGAPELLGSPSMVQLVTGLRSRYGVIVVDSPPLGAGVDAFALATVTGNAVIVLRTGATDRELAEAKLDVLDRLPIRVIGAVLNGVRENNVYRYYSYYLPGYEYEEDEEGGETKLLDRVGPE
jgi:tyrosine-protein kinase Etk/Wzc